MKGYRFAEFQGHHINQAYEKSGIMFAEYKDMQGATRSAIIGC
jgi:hypothetical protein